MNLKCKVFKIIWKKKCYVYFKRFFFYVYILNIWVFQIKYFQKNKIYFYLEV